MNYKQLFNSQERFIGKRQGWRIFLDKEAKYYALNKNDKSPAFTYRSELNRWIANRDKHFAISKRLIKRSCFEDKLRL